MLDDYSIDFIFDELQRINQCNSRSEFSKRWLGRNESYFRSIQSKGLEPSVEVHVNLAARLRELGYSLGRSENPKVAKIGMVYLKLYGECLDALLTRAHLDALNWGSV
jgi:hypothetical protein